MKLSIIIVNYNVKYFTEQCLYSVERACNSLLAEIIVVDNCSTDNSKIYLSEKFTNVQFIWNKENLGFSKANNMGLQQACGEYILFLNPDTIIPEDCLDKCLSFYCRQKDIGALGIRMIDGAGDFLKESKRSFPSISTSFFKLSGLAAVFPHSAMFARYYLGNLPDNISQPVPVLSGAFMMAETALLKKMRGFDEAFFMYGEDIDLSYRIQKAGYKNYYFSESTILHFKGKSTQKATLKYVRLFYGAMVLFVQKHYSFSRALLYRIFIQFAQAVKAITTLFTSSKPITGNAAQSMEALMMGCRKDCDAVSALLGKTTTSVKIIQTLYTDHPQNNQSLFNLQQLQSIINQQQIESLIFCINGFTAKEAIALIQHIHPQINYFFCDAGSASIISSCNKNQKGNLIALQ